MKWSFLSLLNNYIIIYRLSTLASILIDINYLFKLVHLIIFILWCFSRKPPDNDDLIELLVLALEAILDFPALDDPELVDEGPLQSLKVLNLFDAGEVWLRVEYLLDCQHQTRTLDSVLAAPAHSVTCVVNQFWKYQSLDFCLSQPVFLFIDCNPIVSLLNCLVVSCVNNEVILSNYLWPLQLI